MLQFKSMVTMLFIIVIGEMIILWMKYTYCNFFSAAAHNKLSNNDQALADCFRSIEIDPNYSKAYGRLGYVDKNRFDSVK